MKIVKGDFRKKDKPIQRSLDELLELQDDGDAEIDSEYSVIIMELISAYTVESKGIENFEHVLQSALLGWNLAIFKGSGLPGFDEMYKEHYKDRMPGDDGQSIVKEVVEKKIAKFPSHNYFIQDFEIFETIDGAMEVEVFTCGFDEFMNGEDDEDEFDDIFNELEYEEGFVNRSAIIVNPKSIFWDWVIEQDEEYKGKANTFGSNTYLVKQMESEKEFTAYLKKNFDKIFVEEMDKWIDLPELWMENRTFKMFTKFFDVEFRGTVIDLECVPVSKR